MKLILLKFFSLILFSIQSAISQMPDKHLFLSPDIFSSTSFSEIDEELRHLSLWSLDSSLANKNLGIHLFQKDSTWVTWQDCGLNLLIFKNGKWVNLYQFQNFGHTCAGNLLWINENFFLLGGQTKFFKHSDFLEFFEQFGSWELIKLSHQPLDYHAPWIGAGSKGVFSLFGDYFSVRKDIQVKEHEGFYLDFKEKKWKKLAFSWRADGQFSEDGTLIFSIDLKDYSIAFYSDRMLIFNKNSLQLLSSEDERMLFAEIPDYYSVEGNVFSWLSENGLKYQDIASLVRKSDLIAQISIVPQPAEIVPKLRAHNLVIIVSFFFVFFATAFRYYKKKTSLKNTSPDSLLGQVSLPPIESVDPILKFIHACIQDQKEYYNSNELDQILEIQDIENLDHRRVKRSRLIKGINDYSVMHWGKPLIIRERQPDDKRYFRYKIRLPDQRLE